jgi:hypothetical protein
MNGNTGRGIRRPEVGGRVVGRRRQAGRLERKTSSVVLAQGNLHRISVIIMTNYDKKHKPQVLG